MGTRLGVPFYAAAAEATTADRSEWIDKQRGAGHWLAAVEAIEDVDHVLAVGSSDHPTRFQIDASFYDDSAHRGQLAAVVQALWDDRSDPPPAKNGPVHCVTFDLDNTLWPTCVLLLQKTSQPPKGGRRSKTPRPLQQTPSSLVLLFSSH